MFYACPCYLRSSTSDFLTRHAKSNFQVAREPKYVNDVMDSISITWIRFFFFFKPMASTLVSLGRKASQRQHGMKDTCLGPRHRGSQLEEQMRREVVSLELFWKMRTDQLLRRPEAFPLLLIWGPSKCCTTTQNVFSSFSFSTVYWKSDHVDGVNWPDCDSKMILFLLQKTRAAFECSIGPKMT